MEMELPEKWRWRAVSKKSNGFRPSKFSNNFGDSFIPEKAKREDSENFNSSDYFEIFEVGPSLGREIEMFILPISENATERYLLPVEKRGEGGMKGLRRVKR
jgi:hypothetical protein